MKMTRTLRLLVILLSLIITLPLFVACNKASKNPTATNPATDAATNVATDPATEEETDPSDNGTEELPVEPEPTPDFSVPQNASVYSGTPDTSWYTGDKTEYVLTTADQFVGLNRLRQDSKGKITFEGVTIKLGCDMIINQGTMEEIVARGTDNYSLVETASGYFFKGTFDGQGHVISGIYMRNTSSNNRGILGGAGGNAVFKDFTFANTYMTGHIKSGKRTMGGLISKITEEGAHVTISNVDIQCTIAEAGYAVNRVGGFVGTIEGPATLTMENCRFYGSITSTGEEAGGMIGGASNADAVIIMKNCENYADISAKKYVGGLIGHCLVKSVSTSYCINEGKLTADSFLGDLFGMQSAFNDPTNGARPETPSGYVPLRVMSFNLRMTLKHSNTVLNEQSANRVRAVEQEIYYYMPDVIGFQEDNYLWHGNLKLDGYKSVQDLSIKGERVAIYYKDREGLKLLDSGTIWLTPTGTEAGAALTYSDLINKDGPYYLTPEELKLIGVASDVDLRDYKTTYVDQATGQTVTCEKYSILANASRMTWAVFEVDGQIVIHLNTHLQNRGQGYEYSNDAIQKIRSMERLKAFAMMQEELVEIQKKYPNTPVFMTGDWNDHEDSPIFNNVYDAGYVSAHLVANEKYGPAGSMNGAYDDSVQGDCYPGKEGASSSYLDFCFISEGVQALKFRSGDGRGEITLPDGTKKFIYTSDHLPVIADICFKKQ